MSTISSSSSGPVHPDPAATRTAAQSATIKFDPKASADEVERTDTVEISDQAREMAEYKPFSIMNPKKVLVPDSVEEKEFRELMKSVKSQKSDIMSQIENALKASGISTADTGSMKLEVSRSGKIVVGGMKDKDTARAIEAALNKDKTLAGKIRDFQRDEKELSKQIDDYTGCTLFELTMTQRGDVNNRIRGVVESTLEEAQRDEYYWNLVFLGDTKDTVVSVDDVATLGFSGRIDFSGEVDVYANPEENIKETMTSLNDAIAAAFGENNDELTKRLEAGGSKLDDDYRSKYFLSLANARITVDNHGAVTVEGLLSQDERTHQKGVEIIQQLVRDMVNDSESNSYHLNLFTEASEVLLREKADKLGLDESARAWDAKVVAEIANGVVGDINISMAAVEAGIQSSLEKTVNGLIADAGISLPEAVRLEVDDSGKIRAVNLSGGSDEAERVGELLDRLNAEVERTKVEKPGEEKKESQGVTAAERWKDGVLAVAEQVWMLRELRG